MEEEKHDDTCLCAYCFAVRMQKPIHRTQPQH